MTQMGRNQDAKSQFWITLTKALALAPALAALAVPAAAPAEVIPVTSPTAVLQTSATLHPASSATAERRLPGISSLSAEPDTVTSRSAPFPFDEQHMMRSDDVRPGQKAYGYSVFSGLEPEKFDADIIGVRHRMMPGTDIILCRIKSPHLIDLGVIAGMSGSPVYIDGKLIGAVAYGFMDVDDPLAGVTPIETMLKVYNATPETPLPPDDASAGGPGSFELYRAYLNLRVNPTVENLRQVAVKSGAAQPIKLSAADFDPALAQQYGLPAEFELQPLAAPIMLPGGSQLASDLASQFLPGSPIMAGAQPLAASQWAPSASSENSPGGPITDLAAFSQKIAGGYALAIPFVEGDLNMAAVGTVTWREGNRLVAFGHPMFQNGTVHYPMAAARINAIIRSRMKPFKLGEPVGHIGMVRQDRLPAIGGLFGDTAKMIPVTASITDKNYDGSRTFHYRVWEDKQMTPGLVMTAIIESLGAAARQGGDSAALFNYSIALEDGTSITLENYSSDPEGTIMATLQAMADSGALLNNPFKSVSIAGLDFHMEVTDRLRIAKIESAVLDREEYHPGDTATIEWLMRPYRQEPVKLTYSFKVPDFLPEGEYDLAITDAAARSTLERRRNPASDKIQNFDDLVRRIRQNYAQNRIYISLVDQDTGLSVAGSEMPRLPGSVIGLLQDTVASDYQAPVRGNFVLDADLPVKYEVTGAATLKLKVVPPRPN